MIIFLFIIFSASDTIVFMACVKLRNQPGIKLCDKHGVTQAKRVFPDLKPGNILRLNIY